MKYYMLLLFITLASEAVFSQTDSLLNSLQGTTDTVQDVLPKKMLFTQRLVWGDKGLFRGDKLVTSNDRIEDMKLRRKMLVAHQVLGFTTLAGLIGQAVIGPQLYNDPSNRSLKQTHAGIAAFTVTTYSLTAMMSLFAPPPIVNRDKGLSAIRLHKWLSVVHMAGMLATNILASQYENGSNRDLVQYHRTAAYITFASYAASIIVIKL